jgi:DNA polymerase-3 subunit alpha
MSFFGTVAGVEETIQLPAVSSLDPREQLEWEKELIGLYVSDHPLSRYLPLLKNKVTHYSSDLGEASANEKVTVAGLVTKMRTLTTKTGKPMAFATIEDLQGAIELVIFPNTWTKFGSQIHADGLVIADGKVDAASSDPKVLVDGIKALSDDTLEKIDLLTRASEQSTSTYNVTGTSRPIAETMEANSDIAGFELPPPPEPDDWHLMPPPTDSFRDSAPVSSMPIGTAVAVESSAPVATVATETLTLEKPAANNSPLGEMPPMIVSPREAKPSVRGAKVQTKMMTIVLRCSSDKERDIRRLKHVHGLLRANPGADHFCLMIYENGFRHFLDFPNDTTGVTPELIGRLVELVGAENVIVEDVRIK